MADQKGWNVSILDCRLLINSVAPDRYTCPEPSDKTFAVSVKKRMKKLVALHADDEGVRSVVHSRVESLQFAGDSGM